MKTPRPRVRLAAFVLAALAATGAGAMLAGRLAERDGIAVLADRGALELARHAEGLRSEMRRLDFLPGVIALDPVVGDLLRHPQDPARIDAANRYLERSNRAAGATALYVIDRRGRVLASSNWREPISFVGIDLSYRPYFQDAVRTGSGRFFGIGTTSFKPGYYFAQSIANAAGSPGGEVGGGVGVGVGVGVVKVDLDRLQATWTPGGANVMVLDQNGIIVLASRPAWRYRTISALPPAVAADLKRTRQYDTASLAPLGLRVDAVLGPQAQIVSLPDGADGPRRRYLAQLRTVDATAWRIAVLSDLREVENFAAACRIIAALAAAALFLLAMFLRQRRRAIAADRAARQTLAQTNAELERQVATRTRDLLDANRTLHATRDELVHAGKLAALGQFSVGLTHELSQPLAAIQTLSDNARTLIERAEPALAQENLRMIAALIRRMARITAQLKLFARKAPPRHDPVAIGRCIEASLLVLREQIRSAAATVTLDAAADCPAASGDAAGLEQVFVNIIGNALDAVHDCAQPCVQIAARAQGGRVAISVRDNGPGIAAGDLPRLCEPFFTTKPAGVGLGLGLAISEGIVRDLGGALRAENIAGGGCVFTIELPAWSGPAHLPAIADAAAAHV